GLACVDDGSGVRTCAEVVGGTCETALALEEGTTVITIPEGGSSNFECSGYSDTGAEIVVSYTMSAAGNLAASVDQSNVDVVWSARTDCGSIGTEEFCYDSSSSNTLEDLAAGTVVYFIIDTYYSDDAGDVAVTIREDNPVVVASGDPCDPDNVLSSCAEEDESCLSVAGAFTCRT